MIQGILRLWYSKLLLFRYDTRETEALVLLITVYFVMICLWDCFLNLRENLKITVGINHANILQLFLCPGPMSKARYYYGVFWSLYEFLNCWFAWHNFIYPSSKNHYPGYYRTGLLLPGHPRFVPHWSGSTVWHRRKILQKRVSIPRLAYFLEFSCTWISILY